MAINELTIAKQIQMRGMVESYVDASVRALTAQWVTAWNEISDEWRLTVAQIVGARATGEPLSPAQIAQLSRTQQALDITAAKLTELADELGPMLSDPIRQVVEQTADLTTGVAMSQMPPVDASLLPSFTRVDQEALEHIIDRSLTAVVADSAPLADDALEAVKSSLIRAVPSGWSPEKAAREMLKRTRSAFNGGLTRSMVIARTEMLDAHRASNRAQNMANPAVTNVVWTTELDARTCPSCIALQGTEYPVDTVGPNDHQQGRCTFTPKTMSWAALGFPDLDEPDDLTPDPMTWIDEFPQAALSALGPDRYRMLAEGQIQLSDLTQYVENPDWRGSWRPTSISDLKKVAKQ